MTALCCTCLQGSLPFHPSLIWGLIHDGTVNYWLILCNANGCDSTQLRFLLAIAPSSTAIFERYSDSAASFVVLDSTNASVYKQLYRAAKAKLKLRLKVTIIDHPAPAPKQATVEDEEPSPVSPVEEKPSSQQAEVTPTQDLPSTNHSAVPYPVESIRQPSVADIQSRFEDLLLSHPHLTTKAPAPVVSSACCPMLPEHHYSPKMSTNEIPVTRGAAARDKWFAELAGVSQDRQNAIRTHAGAPAASSASIFSVYCNHCTDAIPDEHYHCSTCDDGDFDLCQNCVNDGVLCGGDGHWMIKRFVKNGKVINSTTETIAPKPKVPAFSESKTTLVPDETKITPTRTCNSCIQGMWKRPVVLLYLKPANKIRIACGELCHLHFL